MNAKQLELRPADMPHFDGEPEPAEGVNRPRLARQLQKVFDLMIDGRARTLENIASVVGCSVPSASSRLRDLRKKKIMGKGVCIVTREVVRREDGTPIRGLYEYSIRQEGTT